MYPKTPWVAVSKQKRKGGERTMGRSVIWKTDLKPMPLRPILPLPAALLDSPTWHMAYRSLGWKPRSLW